jgi:hypothetical protein
MRGVLPTVWKERRTQRMRRLENEVAAGKAERAELRRRLELFERIAAAAGAALDDPAQSDAGATETPAPVPPSLLAAAQDPRRSGAPVRLDVDGSELIAVVDGEGGDPHEWWSAIRRLASRLGNAS